MQDILASFLLYSNFKVQVDFYSTEIVNDV